LENFTEIQRFVSVDLLNQVIDILKENNIDYRVEDTSNAFDITFTNSQVNIEFILKVRSDEVQKAKDLLDQNISSDLNVDDHYLNSFSDDELIEIIANPTEWNKFDVEYARRLISTRGIKIDEAEIAREQTRRSEVLKEGIKAKKVVVFCGYLFSIIGGWIGLIIAISLRYTKRTLPNDEKVYYYDNRSRLHGNTMLMIFVFWILAYVVLLAFMW